MRKSPTIAPRKCELCGKVYTPSGTAQKFCQGCKRTKKLLASRKYDSKKYPNRKPKQKTSEVCCVCGGPFSSHFEGKPYCNTHYLRLYAFGTTELAGRKRTNTYDVHGDVTTVTTSNGREFVIDTADLQAVQRYSWCFSKTGYLVANIKGKVVKLHRYLLNPDPSVFVDHVNGDPSDNRRCNLRPCSQTENARNTSVCKTSKSGALGIRQAPSGRYVARITVNRKMITLGTFDSLEAAIAARNEAERQYYGNFAPSISRTST